MTPKEKVMAATAAHSNSDISGAISGLQTKIGAADTINTGALLGIAFLGAVIAIAAILLSRWHNRLDDLKDQAFEQYKISAKHDSDIEIGKAKSEADVKIAKAGTDAEAKIKAASDAADLEIQRVKADAAKATEGAENARLETARLKALVSWRNLTPNQAQRLKLAISKIGGCAAAIISVRDDPEYAAYADQLSAVMQSAGCKINLAHFEGAMNPPLPDGLSVRGIDPNVTEQIAAAFNSAGVSMVDLGQAATMFEAVNIFVGAKPKPPP